MGGRNQLCVYTVSPICVWGGTTHTISCFSFLLLFKELQAVFLFFVFVLYSLSSNHSVLSDAKSGPLPHRDHSSSTGVPLSSNKFLCVRAVCVGRTKQISWFFFFSRSLNRRRRCIIFVVVIWVSYYLPLKYLRNNFLGSYVKRLKENFLSVSKLLSISFGGEYIKEIVLNFFLCCRLVVE
jgi:hypothetical protein